MLSSSRKRSRGLHNFTILHWIQYAYQLRRRKIFKEINVSRRQSVLKYTNNLFTIIYFQRKCTKYVICSRLNAFKMNWFISNQKYQLFHAFDIFRIDVQFNIKHTLYVPQAIIFLDNYDRKPQNCNILWTSSHTYIKTSGWHIRICLLSFILAFPIHLMSSTVSDIYSWLLKIA